MNRFRALILGFATAASAAALAAYNGVFDGPQKPAAVTAAPAAADKTDAPAKTAAPAAESAAAAPEAVKPAEAPVETAKADPAAPAAAEPAVPDAATEPSVPDVAAPAAAPAAAALAPEFGLLRAEPDGSLLVAGKGAPGADIELITGDTMLGKTKAAANGDFAIVLSDPLKAGDYSMVLRTTNPDGKAATSVQTAIVSIPQDLKGEVLAMVEEPGKASRIITAPEAAGKPAEAAAAVPVEPAPVETAAAAPEAPAAAVSPPKKVTIALADVAVEAVEIEGNKIFVAGSAPAGSTIRIYATEMLLGETKATANDRFLLEASRDLAVGDYFIHADTVGPDGKLISRVTVPFTREAGETVVAVAPPEAPKETAAPAAANPAKVPPAAAAEPAKAAETAVEPDAQVAAKTSQPAASDVTVAPALTKADASVIIRRGDSLWRISKRIYGRGVRYSTIYLANKEKVKNPNRIWPGQVMMIPEKTSEGEAADMAEVEKRNKAARAQ